MIEKDDVSLDPENIKAIQEWPTPKIVGELRRFHGLTSFCRRFVQDFSIIDAPLNKLINKDMPFVRGEKKEKSFQTLKDKLTHASILVLLDFLKLLN